MDKVTRRNTDGGRRRNPVRFVGTLLPIAVLLIAGVAMFQQELGSGSASGDRAGPPGSDVVFRVVDGDTVNLQSAGKSRLIGVDTPEVYGGQECFGREASAFTKLARRARERAAGLWSSRSCDGDPNRPAG